MDRGHARRASVSRAGQSWGITEMSEWDPAMYSAKEVSRLEDEIERMRTEGLRFAQWIEDAYGSLPLDRPPGPPTELLRQMRGAFVSHVQKVSNDK